MLRRFYEIHEVKKVNADALPCNAGLLYITLNPSGIERVLNRKARQTPPVPPIAAGEVEAKIIAMCRGDPPRDIAGGPYGFWEAGR
jgi:hypothetical protein